MNKPAILDLDKTENCDFVHGLLERRLARNELEVPLLPEVAMRVVRLSAHDATSAEQLAGIINADPALTMYVLRVAGSAARRPSLPIVSLRQAVAWLGFDEVANIAFTAALQGKMLDVPGQHQAARRLWRHALASAIWSKRLAKKLGQNPAEIYMCGLLHNIGKPVTLVAVHDLARRAKSRLTAEEYERLIETFHRPIGSRVVGTWNLPPCVSSVVSHWETYQGSPAARLECHIVNVAHRLADYTLEDTNPLARDLLIVDPAFAELGFSVSDGAQLFESAAAVSAQMDRYLAP